eukprot:GHVS01068394.1.p1 GENE.GHVS01068394.1~~GHVS01068394.1.p1  ORF type:complete len:256 (-),score=50.37 GHVS01068394.1:194-961(-)
MWAIWNKDLPGDALLTPPPPPAEASLSLVRQPPPRNTNRNKEASYKGTEGRNIGRGENGLEKESKRQTPRCQGLQGPSCQDGQPSIQKEQHNNHMNPLQHLQVKSEAVFRPFNKTAACPWRPDTTATNYRTKPTCSSSSLSTLPPPITSPVTGSPANHLPPVLSPPVGLLCGGAPTTFELIVVCNLLGVLLGLFGLTGGLYLCSVCLSSPGGHIFNGRSCSLQQKVGGPVGVTIGLLTAVLSAGFIYSAVLTRKK